VLKGWLLSSWVRSSSQASGARRGVSFMVHLFA
jgi:hypothetical protein